VRTTGSLSTTVHYANERMTMFALGGGAEQRLADASDSTIGVFRRAEDGVDTTSNFSTAQQIHQQNVARQNMGCSIQYVD
jgi:hypothetical protein